MNKGLRGFQKQVTGIEPASPAWEAGVLPMNYTCINYNVYYNTTRCQNQCCFLTGDFTVSLLLDLSGAFTVSPLPLILYVGLYIELINEITYNKPILIHF